MIVGTAGHIDHGKTTLVRALTGVDTDRLPRRRRAASRSSSASPTATRRRDGDETVGFIDVPGHERFVHTMIAGAGGIDLALLVVAADDGVDAADPRAPRDPRLLGVTARRGRADQGRPRRRRPPRRRRRVAIEALLADTPYRGAPIVAVSTRRRRQRPGRVAARPCGDRAAPRRRRRPLFRLAIDRVVRAAGHRARRHRHRASRDASRSAMRSRAAARRARRRACAASMRRTGRSARPVPASASR